MNDSLQKSSISSSEEPREPREATLGHPWLSVTGYCGRGGLPEVRIPHLGCALREDPRIHGDAVMNQEAPGYVPLGSTPDGTFEQLDEVHVLAAGTRPQCQCLAGFAGPEAVVDHLIRGLAGELAEPCQRFDERIVVRRSSPQVLPAR